ncbi:MAG: hypothetical protein ACYTBJ_25110 [Planctomycetota bacterium]|jgi:hypothetical protein
MAFTEAQKVDIRHYLGFPDVFRQENTRLESAITVVGGRPDTQALVEEILAELALIDTKLGSSGILTQAGVKKVDEIEFFGNQYGGGALSDVRRAGRQQCARLSIVMGVPLVGDVYGERGYEGDRWQARSFQYGTFPLG